MMEISNELLIDVGLNVVGFILAGVLTAVIYSMFGRKNKSALGVDLNSGVVSNNAIAPSHGLAGAKIEFIDFQSKGKSAVKGVVTNANLTGENKQFQRNRLEVIKQATEMLKGGKLTGDVKRNLALTDSDFQLSNQGHKVLAKRGVANGQ